MEKKKKPLNLRLVVSATLMGNTLEWYDYATFGFYVPIFAVIFFNNNDPFVSILQSLMIYGLGQISRPIGGVVFGFIADRWGRKVSLIASILCMTGPICVITLLPTYLQIGLAAPLIFALMRIFQGIAAGGEFPVILSYLVESSPWRKRGFFGSFAFIGVMLGILIGVFEYTLIHFNMSPQDIQDWAWRIPFALGILLGGTTFYLRWKLHETPLFRETMRHSVLDRDPFWAMLKQHKRALVNVWGLGMLETAAFSILIICMVPHFTHFLKIPLQEVLILNLLLLFFIQIFLPIMGKVGDRFGHRNLAFYSAVGFLLFSYPLYCLFDHWSNLVRTLGVLGFAILFSGYASSLPALFCDIFPTHVRCSGIGLSYNLTIGLFGGFTPVAVFYFNKHFQHPHISPMFIMAAALISLLTLSIFKKQRTYLASNDAV